MSGLWTRRRNVVIAVLAGVGGLVVLAAIWARLLAGGPVLPGIPGGWVRGELASELPSDWSFANREDYLLVESRAGGLPWSGTVWFLTYQGRLHLLLPAFFGDELQRRLERDPRLRVAIDGRLYPQVTVPIDPETGLEGLVGPVLRRQFAIDVGGPVRLAPGAGDEIAMAIFRLEDPPARPSAP